MIQHPPTFEVVHGKEGVVSGPNSKQESTAVSRMVQVPHGRVHVTDYPGHDPALVLMHGFPDDSRIYDRLAPLLAPQRAIAMDWLGYGRSERVQPSTHDAQHQQQLAAVLDSLQLDHVILVGHDASGPDAIDYAVNNPGRVNHLILLNTYYGHASALRLPELIRLLADPNLTALADEMIEDPNQRLWLLAYTARRFGLDANDQSGIAVASVLPQFFGDHDSPDALSAIRAWTANLFPSLDHHDSHIAAGDLAGLDLPVTLAFGTADPYLNPDLARHLTGLFRHADLHLLESASHWPQWDQPEHTARLIMQASLR